MIYGLFDPQTTHCRYVGKTCRTLQARLRQHCNRAKSGAPQHVSAWIRSLASRGLVPEIDWIEENSEDWREAECFWIAYLRSIGCDLTNISPGGEGVPMTPEIAERISATRKRLGYTLSRESIEKSLATRSERWEDPEWRADMKAKKSRAFKSLWQDPAYSTKVKEARKAAMTPESIKTRSAAVAAALAKAKERNGGVDPKAKTTLLQVCEIRAYKDAGMSDTEIARITSVKKGTVVAITRRDNWKHILP